MGAVYAGWLTKSPEDRKGILSLFAARRQWKRRFFVLYSPPISPEVDTWTSPSSVLAYYEDEAMTVRKGVIDLGSCEEVIDHCESCYYRHLFLLKTTTQRGHRRTYYLAADSADDITNWVRKLRSTLNLYEDKLFSNAVLSITNSGSNVTGIIARVTNSEASSDNSKTNAKKTTINAALMSDSPNTAVISPLSHARTKVVNSESPARGLDLLSNDAELCDASSGIPVSKCQTILDNPEIPVKPITSAETGSPRALNPVSSVTRSVGFRPSPATSGQPCDLQNEASSSDACTVQIGTEYFEEWPQLVKDLLDDGPSKPDYTVEGDAHRGTEGDEDEEQERQLEGRSAFYVYASSFSPDTKATENAAHKARRPNSSESNEEVLPSAQPSSDVTCYLRITRGSRRYRSIKKKQRMQVAYRDAAF